MKTQYTSTITFLRTLFFGLLLAVAAPAMAQNARNITKATPMISQEALTTAQFRAQYDTMMSNFERLANTQGDSSILAKASAGRAAMSRVSDQQLAIIVARTRNPDLSGAVLASEVLASKPAKSVRKSLPFPVAGPVIGNCDSVDSSSSFRYGALIAKEVTTSILAAATFVCTQDILGENGSAACIPLAIAADIAIALYEVATFCADESAGSVADAGYLRLEHLHNDLNTGMTNIINNDNSNKTTIVNNDNANTSNIIANDNSNKTTIVNNANANTATIVNNDNANKNAIIAELRAISCEIIRLLHTPDGQRTSTLQACTAAPGFPYSWNKK